MHTTDICDKILHIKVSNIVFADAIGDFCT